MKNFQCDKGGPTRGFGCRLNYTALSQRLGLVKILDLIGCDSIHRYNYA